MPGRKLVHITPQLKEIISNLQTSNVLQSREIENLVERTAIYSSNFKSENTYDNRFQKLELGFVIATSATNKSPTKKKAKKEEEGGDGEERGLRNLYFEYESLWNRDRHQVESSTANLRVLGITALPDPLLQPVLELGDPDPQDDTLTIHWDNLDKICAKLHSTVDPAHLLEIIRCALYCSKSTRIMPDKWILPKTKPEGGTQVIPSIYYDPTKPIVLTEREKEKIVPTTKDGVRQFVDGHITKLTDHLIKLCQQIETCTLPVYPKSVFIHASPVKPTSVRKYEIEVQVIVVVDAEDDGSIKTSADHKLIVAILDEFARKGEVHLVYRDYKNLPSYLPVLLAKKLPHLTQVERTRLLSVCHPWFNHLSQWDDISAKKGYPWAPSRIMTHLLKCNLSIKIELRTEEPLTRPARITRGNANEKYFVKLWTVGEEKIGLEEIIKKEVSPVADTIVESC